MKQPKEWAVLLSIQQQHAANIYAGTKRAELRKSVPRYNPENCAPAVYPIRVYMYESKTGGGPGMITGFFTCPAFVGVRKETPEDQYPASFAERAQVPTEYVENYGGGGWVYAWEVREPTRLPEPVPLSALGFTCPPQSWRYLNASDCSRLREVAKNGTKP